MKIDEAIEVLEIEVKVAKLTWGSSLPPALQLGIEALKRAKRNRNKDYSFGELEIYELLPGETEEVDH